MHHPLLHKLLLSAVERKQGQYATDGRTQEKVAQTVLKRCTGEAVTCPVTASLNSNIMGMKTAKCSFSDARLLQKVADVVAVDDSTAPTWLPSTASHFLHSM